MRIVAKIILAVIGGVAIIAITPFVLAILGTARLLDWADLHGAHDGDKIARDRARWLDS